MTQQSTATTIKGAESATKENQKRVFYLDNLKIALVCLVIADHAGQAYVSFYTGYPLVENNIPAINNWLLGTFFSVDNAFFMALFFLISAYFIPASVQRKGTQLYLKDRLIRFGAPIVFFSLIVFPILGILISGSPVLQLGHTWFLAMLLIFSTAYVVYLWAMPNSVIKWKHVAIPKNATILALALLLTGGLFVSRLFFAPGEWLFFHLFEPARILAYIAMFIFGIIAYQNDWLNNISTKTGKIWGAVAVGTILSTPIVVFLGNGQDLWAMGFNISSLAVSAWDAFLCVGLCISLPILFRQKFNKKPKILSSDDSFGAYLIHPFILLLIQGLFLSLPIPSLAKFVVVSIIGIGLSFYIVHLLRKFPRMNQFL